MERTALPPSYFSCDLERLACARLAGMVQGLLSFGLPLLVDGGIDVRAFFGSRFHNLHAFATVLGCVGGPEVADRYERLKNLAGRIATSLREVEREVTAAIDRPPGPDRIGDALSPPVAALFDALSAYADTLATDAGVDKAHGIVLGVLETLRSERPTCEPSLH